MTSVDQASSEGYADLDPAATLAAVEERLLMRRAGEVEDMLLRTLGDVFPHSSSHGLTRLDHDHATPYDRNGPPGQTGDHNDAPLTRKHHRAKTHCGYRVDQLGHGAYRRITPHGLARLVTPRGTRKVELLRDERGQPIGELYAGPAIDLTDFGAG